MAKTPLADAVKEVVDVNLIRNSINRWLGAEATDIQREAALKAIPGIIAALIRATKGQAKDDAVEYNPDLG